MSPDSSYTVQNLPSVHLLPMTDGVHRQQDFTCAQEKSSGGHGRLSCWDPDRTSGQWAPTGLLGTAQHSWRCPVPSVVHLCMLLPISEGWFLCAEAVGTHFHGAHMVSGAPGVWVQLLGAEQKAHNTVT